MPFNRLYHIWFMQIKQQYPEQRVTQQRNLAWMIKKGVAVVGRPQ